MISAPEDLPEQYELFTAACQDCFVTLSIPRDETVEECPVCGGEDMELVAN